MMYSRLLFEKIQKSQKAQKAMKSYLILGPRQTGKSTLIQSLSPDLTINLAREQTFLEYSSQPDRLERTVATGKIKTVFIDEVQRIPSLLNTIQAILDESRIGKVVGSQQKRMQSDPIQFYLTGSSARKLKRGQANLLPGRIITFALAPLALKEIEYEYDLDEVLSTGLLPGIFSEEDKDVRRQILNSYAGTYLKEEIQAEALTKNIEGFSRFLFVCAAKNGEFLDFSKIGTQASITQKTASRFFEILEDTLIVHRVNSFAQNELRRLIKHPKFYFFDTGILNALIGHFHVTEDRKGMLFETLVFNQIRTLGEVSGKSIRLSTYRTEADAEVDLILEFEDQVWAIEIKASTNIGKADLRGFKSFEDYYSKKHRQWVIYLGRQRQKIGKIDVLPLDEALEEMRTEFGGG